MAIRCQRLGLWKKFSRRDAKVRSHKGRTPAGALPGVFAPSREVQSLRLRIQQSAASFLWREESTSAQAARFGQMQPGRITNPLLRVSPPLTLKVNCEPLDPQSAKGGVHVSAS